MVSEIFLHNMEPQLDTEDPEEMLKVLDNMKVGGEVTLETTKTKINRAVYLVNENSIGVGDPINPETHRLLEEKNGKLVSRKLPNTEGEEYSRPTEIKRLRVWNYEKPKNADESSLLESMWKKSPEK